MSTSLELTFVWTKGWETDLSFLCFKVDKQDLHMRKVCFIPISGMAGCVLQQSPQKILPQTRQWCFRFNKSKRALHRPQTLTFSSFSHSLMETVAIIFSKFVRPKQKQCSITS
eukprot:Lithocolla_globosa_v1_NODE_11508_length_503_cov_2.765625.p2 type:complete len:113 gc:universal NODE_11508_length_503_cov_2.765625:399-61(-)